MTARPSTDGIWENLSADLRRFIRRKVSDDHVADDLLQETFVRVHRGLPTLQEADRLAAWVYRIARNVINDHHRQGARTALPLADDPVEEVDERSCCSPSSAGEWLGEMIRQLPDGYRQALQLSEIDGLPQQEVADRLGLSLSGAKSRIQRGRVMLKGLLEECCHFEFDRRGNVMGYDPKPNRTAGCNCDEEGCCP
jgi:RNA polymerase sigma-70 factor (ECF subfamily)